MIRILKILLFVFAAAYSNVNGFFQTEAETSMQNGNSLYQRGEFESAAASYENVLSSGYESSALYYNLGNTYFRMNKLGKAILNYEKALKLEPGDEDVIYNLRIAKARTVDQIQAVPKIFISQWWDYLVTAFSVSGWGVVFICIYVTLLLLIATYLLTRSGKVQRLVFYIGSINFVIALVVLVLFISSYNREATSNFGILIEDTISVKQSPNEQSSDAFVIHEGVKFQIDETLNNWVKIKLADGKVGWLPQNSFEAI